MIVKNFSPQPKWAAEGETGAPSEHWVYAFGDTGCARPSASAFGLRPRTEPSRIVTTSLTRYIAAASQGAGSEVA